MRCAIYCRLSREDEEKLAESESIQNQKSLLLKYAMEQGWDVYQLYSDEDYSGADRSRPAFQEMLRAAEAKRFDLILCKTQSRFTRDMELVERYIHGLFPLWGIRFVAIADHIDTGLKGNKKARQINGLVNEWYLEDLSENIRMVLDHKRRQGLYIGGFPLYGYEKHPTEKGRLVVDPQAAAVVRQIFHWALDGQGKQQIADRLNRAGHPNPSRYKQEQGSHYHNGSMTDPRGLWNRATVGRILQNEMYLGNMVQGTQKKASFKSKKLLPVPRDDWFRVEGTHEAIIDLETFQTVQHLHASRQKTDGKGETHPLAGLVFCRHCGGAMQKNAYTYQGTRHSYLRCPDKGCPGRQDGNRTYSIRLENLLFLVKEQVNRYLINWGAQVQAGPGTANTLARDSANLHRELSLLEARLKKHVNAQKSLYWDKIEGYITPQQFQDLSESFKDEAASLRQRKERLREQLMQVEDPSRKENTMAGWIEELRSSPLTRALSTRLIHKIEVDGKDKKSYRQTVVIHWNF